MAIMKTTCDVDADRYEWMSHEKSRKIEQDAWNPSGGLLRKLS